MCVCLLVQLEIKVCDQPVTRPHTVHARHYAEDSLGIEYHNSVVTKVDKESAADMGGIMAGESILEVYIYIYYTLRACICSSFCHHVLSCRGGVCCLQQGQHVVYAGLRDVQACLGRGRPLL